MVASVSSGPRRETKMFASRIAALMGSFRSPTTVACSRRWSSGGTFRGRRLRSRLHNRFWSLVSRHLPYGCQLVVGAGWHRLLCDRTRVANPLRRGMRGRLRWRCTHRLNWHRSDRTHHRQIRPSRGRTCRLSFADDRHTLRADSRYRATQVGAEATLHGDSTLQLRVCDSLGGDVRLNPLEVSHRCL